MLSSPHQFILTMATALFFSGLVTLVVGVIILASQGFTKIKEANELIDRNLRSPMASAQDKRLKVQLLLADPRHDWAEIVGADAQEGAVIAERTDEILNPDRWSGGTDPG